MLEIFQHPAPGIPHLSPHKHVEPQYGAKQQFANPQDPVQPTVSTQDIKYIQEVVGSLLYYGRGVDPTILVALSAIAAHQTIASDEMVAAARQLLDYVATYLNVGITYQSSGRQLAADVDAGYLNELNGRVGWVHIFFSPKRSPSHPLMVPSM